MDEPRRTGQNGSEGPSVTGPGGSIEASPDLGKRLVPEQAINQAAYPTHVVEIDYDQTPEPVGTALVEAIADVRDVSPSLVVDRVSDEVDPDALERLFRPSSNASDRTGWLTFEFAGTWVTVTADREVRIYDPTETEMPE